MGSLFSKRDFLFVGVLLIAFTIIFAWFSWFTLDDAYITFRYSKNLAKGYGLVWNPGQKPVEGYTSFLWVVLNALAVRAGFDPVLFSKVISIVSAWALIVGVYRFALYRTGRRDVAFVFSAALAVNPAFALLSVQGMETTFATLLLFVSSVVALSLFEHYSIWKVALYFVVSFLAFLTRPDFLVFTGVLSLIVIYIFWRRANYNAFTNFLILSTLLYVLPLVAYMLWRFLYFGWLFPNTFYVKHSNSFVSLVGVFYVFEFLATVAGPYLLLALFGMVITARSQKKHINDRFFGISVALSCGAFLILYFFITPIQGFLWRFQYPVFPIILLLSAVFAAPFFKRLSSVARYYLTKYWFVAIVGVVFVLSVFQMHTLDDVIYNTKLRTQYDRVVVGQSLARLADRGYVMFVTESGALPYYSGWVSYDYIGLTDEHVAHSGLSKEYLHDISPDLFMVLLWAGNTIREQYPLIYSYLLEENYVAVAAVAKNSWQVHLYFAKDSVATDIAREICSAQVDFRDPQTFVGDLPVFPRYCKSNT